MMHAKFAQLSPGQYFTYADETYRKLNPVVAVHAGTGKQKIIPRSAQVELLAATSGKQVDTGLVSARDVADEFERWYSECRAFVADSLDDGQRQQVLETLDKARQQFLDQLQTMQT